MIDQNDEKIIIQKVLRKLQKPGLDLPDVNNVVEYHTHNGIDAPQIDYKNILNTPVATGVSGGSSGVALAAGNNKDIQFNDGGVLGGDDGLEWDKSAKSLILKG